MNTQTTSAFDSVLSALCKAQGKTILIAEHRLHYLMDIADRVVLMQDSIIAQCMDIADFRAMTKAERIAARLRCRSLHDVTIIR